jgi:hypothetical protein
MSIPHGLDIYSCKLNTRNLQSTIKTPQIPTSTHDRHEERTETDDNLTRCLPCNAGLALV